MRICIYRDQWIKRLFGVLIGAGFVAVGLYSVFGPGTEPEWRTLTEYSRDRAFWYGVCAILIGLLAIVVSLTVRELDNIWCRHPRRW